MVVSLALAAIFCTEFSWALQIALSVMLLAGIFFTRPRDQWCRLKFDRQWFGWRLDAHESMLRLDSAVVWPMLIVLRFRDAQLPDRGFNVVLLPDSLDADSWRRLRLHLRHHDVFSADAGDIPAIDQRPP